MKRTALNPAGPGLRRLLELLDRPSERSSIEPSRPITRMPWTRPKRRRLMRASPLSRWLNSCAITPCSSSRESSRRHPSVTATADREASRPTGACGSSRGAGWRRPAATGRRDGVGRGAHRAGLVDADPRDQRDGGDRDPPEQVEVPEGRDSLEAVVQEVDEGEPHGRIDGQHRPCNGEAEERDQPPCAVSGSLLRLEEVHQANETFTASRSTARSISQPRASANPAMLAMIEVGKTSRPVLYAITASL